MITIIGLNKVWYGIRNTKEKSLVMKSFYKFSGMLIIASLMGVSCANQRYVSTETDDIYYSSKDRYQETDNEFNRVKEVNPEDYKNPGEESTSQYYSIGKEVSDKANPNAERAYSESQSYVADTEQQSTVESGATVNNFYGNTTYSEGDYYEDSYASRIRRFDQPNNGYGYYDPFYMEPHWNYGWSYWNPYPTLGWGVGYNSWAGWNAGFSYRWGNGWYGAPLWYRNQGNFAYWDYWSFGYPYNGAWGMGCYPYNYGFGFGGYNGGYWNGYNDGFYNGINYNGVGGNSRPIMNSRSPIANNSGFSGNVANNPRDSRIQNREILESTGMASNRNVVLKDDVSTTRRPVNQTSTRPKADAQPVNRRNDELVANANSKIAATKYSNTPRTEARTKYDLAGKQTVSSNRQNSSVVGAVSASRDRAASAYSGSSRTTYVKNETSTPRVNTPRDYGTTTRTESVIPKATAPSRTREVSSPTNNQTTVPNTYRSPREATSGSARTKQSPVRTATPSRESTTPSRGNFPSKTRTSPPQRQRSTSPRTNSRSNSSYSTPKSNSSIKRNSGSSGMRSPNVSSPSRQSSPSSSPRSSSSPSRSSGSRR